MSWKADFRNLSSTVSACWPSSSLIDPKLSGSTDSNSQFTLGPVARERLGMKLRRAELLVGWRPSRPAMLQPMGDQRSHQQPAGDHAASLSRFHRQAWRASLNFEVAQCVVTGMPARKGVLQPLAIRVLQLSNFGFVASQVNQVTTPI